MAPVWWLAVLTVLVGVGAVPLSIYFFGRSMHRQVESLLLHREKTEIIGGTPRDLAERKLALEEERMRFELGLRRDTAQRKQKLEDEARIRSFASGRGSLQNPEDS